MRRAIISIPPDLLAKMLQLPEGVKVHSVNADWRRNSIEIMLTGDGLPSVTECLPGMYPAELSYEAEIKEDGRIKVVL